MTEGTNRRSLRSSILTADAHTHAPAEASFRQSSGHNSFNCSSHAPKHLSDTLITRLAQTTSENNMAIAKHFTPVTWDKYKLVVDMQEVYDSPDPEHILYFDSEYILYYFTLFDEVFFCGSLKSHCHVVHEEKKQTSEWQEYTIKSVSYLGGSIGSRIVVHTLPLTSTSLHNRYQRLRSYLSALLFEMIVVFFGTFSCRHNFCLSEVNGWIGLGCGQLWQEIAFRFEDSAKEYLKLDLDLLRKWAWVVELKFSRRYMDGDIDVGQFGFDREEILDLIRKFDVSSVEDAKARRSFIEWAREKAERETIRKRWEPGKRR